MNQTTEPGAQRSVLFGEAFRKDGWIMSIEKKIDVTALGELLIDFTQNGISEQGNNLFEANPGGAPCNVLAMLNKAGKKTAFIGKVDRFLLLQKSRRRRNAYRGRGRETPRPY